MANYKTKLYYQKLAHAQKGFIDTLEPVTAAEHRAHHIYRDQMNKLLKYL